MNRLNTIDGETLMTTPLPAIRFVVDQLLPQPDAGQPPAPHRL